MIPGLAAPAAASSEVAAALLDLLIVLVAAKLGDEVMRRLHQPGLIGEILGGVLVGPSVLGWVEITDTLSVFSELGLVFLLFWVGIETRIGEIREVGASALRVAVLGFVLPFVFGVGGGLVFGQDVETSLFIGAALVATSVGITSAVMMELRILGTRAARTILGAAVVDDILAMLLLAIVAGVVGDGGVDPLSLAITLGLMVAFIAFFGLGGTRVAARWPQFLEAPKFSESPLLPAVILCLAVSVLAAEIGLALIIGAFLAGLIVAETKERTPIETEVAPLTAFFAPFFFAVIGVTVDVGALFSPAALGGLAAITVVAVLAKFAGAYLGARSLGRAGAMVVGIGMVPRGEVGIVVAAVGASVGIFDATLFAVIVGMSVLTTFIAPFALRVAARSLPPDPEPAGG